MTFAAVNGDNSDAYAAAVAAVEHGLIEINTDPTEGIPALRVKLAALHEFAPLLAHDPAALELRTMAELALARALLSGGDREAAATTVDATLESLADAPLPSVRLGPSLGALVEERRRALAARGQAQLRIACTVACRVYIDERASTAAEGGGVALPLGEHRVWIEAEGGSAEPLRTSLRLNDPAAALTLAYPEGGAAPAPALVGPAPIGDRDPAEHPQIRVAPRWAEVTTMLVGSAALVAGAVLWAIDSQCPRGIDPQDFVACPELYDTRGVGIGLVSAGAATALTGGVLLVVDETRVGDRRGREFALVWTTRF